MLISDPSNLKEALRLAHAEIERLRAKIAKADYLLTQGAPTLALEALQTP